MPKEFTGVTIGEVIVVDDMHKRKAEMARLADAFIALPGGYGTMEEVLEMITWVQLGIHKKPVSLLNIEGFYDTLLSFIDLAVEEGFISHEARQIVISASTTNELLRKLEEYVLDYHTPLFWGTDQPVQSHVQGVPGGEAGFFDGVKSGIFTSKLWECARYVPKRFGFRYQEFPGFEERGGSGRGYAG